MPDTLPDLAFWGIDLAGYTVFAPPDPFEDHVGPFFFRIDGDTRKADAVHCVLPTLPRHGNYLGGVHGGGILTLADYALCLVAGRAADGGTNSSFALTVSIAVEFLNGARVGPPLEARGEPLQVTGRLAFARGSITQEGRPIALWSGVCRHVARAKAMTRKEEQTAARGDLPPQAAPLGFEPFKASPYSTHIGPAFVRKEKDGATLVQPTLARMCNSGGALHGGYLMSFADTAVTRAAAMTTDMAPATVSFAAEFLSAGNISAPLTTRVEVPKQGKSIAFLRGLLEQEGRAVLSYSATVMLRPRG